MYHSRSLTDHKNRSPRRVNPPSASVNVTGELTERPQGSTDSREYIEREGKSTLLSKLFVMKGETLP